MTEPPETWSVEALRANEAWLRPLVRTLVVDDGAASDVLQETWLRAWRSPPRALGAASSWLATVARNLASTHRRREQRRHRHETARADVAAAAADLQSTDATVERLALQRAVSQAVVDLPEPLRTAILLHHFHGLDVATIAERTGATAANVRQRLHRGREWLRERLTCRLGEPWRRSPAVAALLAGGPTFPPPSLTFTAPPLLFAMTKARVALAVLVVGSLLAVPLLAPLLADPALERGEAHAAAERTAAAASEPAVPGTSGITPAPTDALRIAAATAPADSAAPWRGQVVDVRGRPVAGATIAWLRGSTLEADDLAVSGADGTFTWIDPTALTPLVVPDRGEPTLRRLAV